MVRTLYVRLRGGLGNQLFQLAAAANFSTKFRHRVALDASVFSRNWRRDPRPLELSKDGLPIPLVDLNPLVARVLSRLPGDLSVHQTASGIPEPSERTLYISGYFQSFESASSASPILNTYLSSSLGQTESTGDFVAVHCRLGDYLEPGVRNSHGVTNPFWSITQARQLGAEIGVDRIRVFTDSPSQLSAIVGKNELSGLELDSSQGAWDFLTSASRARGLVTSNSSLSWWAGHIAHHVRLSPIPVVMPFPWMASPTAMDEALRVPGWKVVHRDIL